MLRSLRFQSQDLVLLQSKFAFLATTWAHELYSSTRKESAQGALGNKFVFVAMIHDTEEKEDYNAAFVASRLEQERECTHVLENSRKVTPSANCDEKVTSSLDSATNILEHSKPIKSIDPGCQSHKARDMSSTTAGQSWYQSTVPPKSRFPHRIPLLCAFELMKWMLHGISEFEEIAKSALTHPAGIRDPTKIRGACLQCTTDRSRVFARGVLGSGAEKRLLGMRYNVCRRVFRKLSPDCLSMRTQEWYDVALCRHSLERRNTGRLSHTSFSAGFRSSNQPVILHSYRNKFCEKNLNQHAAFLFYFPSSRRVALLFPFVHKGRDWDHETRNQFRIKLQKLHLSTTHRKLEGDSTTLLFMKVPHKVISVLLAGTRIWGPTSSRYDIQDNFLHNHGSSGHAKKLRNPREHSRHFLFGCRL